MSAQPASAPSFDVPEPGDSIATKVGQRTLAIPRFNVDTLAGRYIVFCCFGSAATPQGRAALEALWKNRDLFDDRRISFFGVSVDPEDEKQGRFQEAMPGVRFMLDHDASVSRTCGAVSSNPVAGQARAYRQVWVLIDPSLHVMRTFTFEEAGPDHDHVFACLRQLPPPDSFSGIEIPAPILILPRVFILPLPDRPLRGRWRQRIRRHTQQCTCARP